MADRDIVEEQDKDWTTNATVLFKKSYSFKKKKGRNMFFLHLAAGLKVASCKIQSGGSGWLGPSPVSHPGVCSVGGGCETKSTKSQGDILGTQQELVTQFTRGVYSWYESSLQKHVYFLFSISNQLNLKLKSSCTDLSASRSFRSCPVGWQGFNTRTPREGCGLHLVRKADMKR